MDAMTKRFALQELRKLKKWEMEERESREEWYRKGEGRSPRWYQGPNDDRRYNYGGKGWAYPYCPHGTSQWTDYDNICGRCEDGHSVYQLAIWAAQEKAAEIKERIDWLTSAPKSFRHTDMWKETLDWAIKGIQ